MTDWYLYQWLHFSLWSQQHCSLIHLWISGPDTQLFQRGGGWRRRWWGWALFSRMISDITVLLWDWASAPPFDFLPSPQVECDTGNKLPLARDVIFLSLHLFIPLYINLYFYQFIYLVRMCIHICAYSHTGFVSWGLISCVLMVLFLLKYVSKPQVRHEEGASAGRNFTLTAFSWSSYGLKNIFSPKILLYLLLFYSKISSLSL